jgi:hypothetical protein
MKKCREYAEKGSSYTQQREERQTGEVRTCVERSKLAWELPTLKNVIEGKIEGKAKEKRTGGRRSKQLPTHIKKWNMYRNLKENVDLQYRYLCKTWFRRG